MKIFYRLLLVPFFFLSCKPGIRAPFAVRDFRATLQPYLRAVITQGYLGYGDVTAFIRKNATTAELRQMTQSEHPLLRGMALRELLDRPEVDHFDLIMHHLEDTALISVDMGEWGLRYRMVSDDLIHNAKWKTEADRKKTADAIVTQHDYLESAYSALSMIDTAARYYPHIKAMSVRDKPNWDLESAWYALARYRRPQDVRLIRDILETRIGLIGETLTLISDFPDTAYFPLLQLYYRKYFYRGVCLESIWNPRVAFYGAIAVYRNDGSAKILDSMLNRNPFMPCLIDSSDLKDQLMAAIWNNPCNAYASLRSRIKPYMVAKERADWERQRKHQDQWMPDTTNYLPKDTSTEQVRWY